jgi:NAD(P)-dependent dehydrogenase (short-subunit alcohol dehydrogenase family)
MSDQNPPQKPIQRTLTKSGRSRRQFLEGTALAAAGTSAALLPGMRSAQAATAAATNGAPASCPSIPLPMKDVEGKVAFITGGDSGIGLGIARAFVDAGMKVAITYRTKSHLDEAMTYLKSAGDRVHAINLDVTDRAGFEKAAVETVDRFKKVHVLVNNAGVGIIGGLSTATYDDWDWGMGVNLTGVFNGIRTFLPRIQSHGEGGHVISTSSLAGLLGHGPAGVYTATKFAVVGLMEALRFELATTNVGVTVFCPGIVNTNIGQSARNRPSTLADSGFKPDPKMLAAMPKEMREMRGPPPGMDALEAGQRVLKGMRNNDLYVLTTPEFEEEFRARGEAIVASVPNDVKVPPGRENFGRMILGKTQYAVERDRKRCERAASVKKA